MQSIEDTFSSLWWRDGFHNSREVLCLLNACCGMQVRSTIPSLQKVVPLKLTSDIAGYEAGRLLDGEKGLEIQFLCEKDGTVLHPVENPARIPRLIELGRYIQRLDLPDIAMGEFDSIVCRAECTMHPGQLLLDLEAPAGCRAGVWVGGEIGLHPCRVPEALWLLDDDRRFCIKLDESVEVCEEKNGFALLGRTEKLLLKILFSDYVYPQGQNDGTVCVTYSTQQEAELPALYDDTHGWFSIPTPDTHLDMTCREDRERVDHVRVILRNTGDREVRIPLNFEAGGLGHITGVGMLAHYADGTGRTYPFPFQISKNWHQPLDGTKLLYQGPWIHAHIEVALEPGETLPLDVEVIRAAYYGAFAASHSQLCLIGWGVDQQWDQDALGCFGESICYDPEICLDRSMIDDIRPLCVEGMNGDTFSWTNNLGGGDFLYVVRDGRRQYLSAVTTQSVSSGPCYTETIYRARLNEAVCATIGVSLMRSDDVVRAVHTFHYRVQDDLPFDYLALYQLGADGYNDNVDARVALGNGDGLVEEWRLSPDAPAGQYLAEGRCIPLPAWGCLTGSGLMPAEKGGGGNRAIIVRRYRAVLGGVVYDAPCLSIRTTHDQIGNASVELSLPKGCRMLHRGDSIDCELELVILPRRKSEYYGPSQYLQQTDAALFDTWEMVHRQCLNGSYKIMCAQGRHSKESIYPIAIETAEQDGVYAVFSLTGGLSYLPVVFTGIRENVCFLLQERINEEWVVSSDNTARQVLQDANGFRVLMNLYRDGKGDTTYRLINPLQAEKDAGRNGQL